MATSSKPQVNSTCDIFRNMRAPRAHAAELCAWKKGPKLIEVELDGANETT